MAEIANKDKWGKPSSGNRIAYYFDYDLLLGQYTNFDIPLYLDLSNLPQEVWDKIDDGSGLAPIDREGNTLPYELVWINTIEQTGGMYVKVDDVRRPSVEPKSFGSYFYLYYNSKKNTITPENIWGQGGDGQHNVVLHMEDDSITDSSNNNITSTNVGTTAGSSAWGGTRVFDGLDDKIDMNLGGFQYSSDYVIDMILKLDSYTTDMSLCLMPNVAVTNHEFVAYRLNNGVVEIWTGTGTSWVAVSSQLPLGQYVHLTIISEGSSAPVGEANIRTVVNGVVSASTNVVVSDFIPNDVNLGGQYDGQYRDFFDGEIAMFKMWDNFTGGSPPYYRNDYDYYTMIYDNYTSNSTFFLNTEPQYNSRWYDLSFKFRKEVEVDVATYVSNNNVVYYLDLSRLGVDFWDNVNSDGSDIRVTKATGGEQDYELLNFDKVAQTGLIFLTASDSSNKNFIYWGNQNSGIASKNNPTGVWTGNYNAVYHLDDDPTGVVTDSSGNNNSYETIGFSSADSVAGKIGNGIDFKKSEQNIIKITHDSIFSPASNTGIFISCWVYVTDNARRNMVVGKRDSNEYFIGFNTTGEPAIYTLGYNTETSIPTGDHISLNTWHYVAWWWNEGTGQIYIWLDGALVLNTTTADPSPAGVSDFYIGSDQVGSYYFDGIIDELKVKTNLPGFSLSAATDIINFEYNNVINQNTVVTFGATEEYNWAYDGWANRIQVSENYLPQSNVDVFPMILDPVDIPVDMRNAIKSDGGDLRSTGHDGTATPMEIEYDKTSNTGDLYFGGRVGVGGAYIYGGNGAASKPIDTDPLGKYTLWQDWDFVYHFSDITGGQLEAVNDSGQNLTVNGTLDNTDITASPLNKALRIEEENDYLSSSGHLLSTTGHLRITFKYRVHDMNTEDIEVFNMDGDNGSFLNFRIESFTKPTLEVYDGVNPPSALNTQFPDLVTGQWYFIDIYFSSGITIVYQDGVYVGNISTDPIAFSASIYDIRMGKEYSLGSGLKIPIELDEFRVYDSANLSLGFDSSNVLNNTINKYKESYTVHGIEYPLSSTGRRKPTSATDVGGNTLNPNNILLDDGNFAVMSSSGLGARLGAYFGNYTTGGASEYSVPDNYPKATTSSSYDWYLSMGNSVGQEALDLYQITSRSNRFSKNSISPLDINNNNFKLEIIGYNSTPTNGVRGLLLDGFNFNIPETAIVLGIEVYSKYGHDTLNNELDLDYIEAEVYYFDTEPPDTTASGEQSLIVDGVEDVVSEVSIKLLGDEDSFTDKSFKFSNIEDAILTENNISMHGEDNTFDNKNIAMSAVIFESDSKGITMEGITGAGDYKDLLMRGEDSLTSEQNIKMEGALGSNILDNIGANDVIEFLRIFESNIEEAVQTTDTITLELEEQLNINDLELPMPNDVELRFTEQGEMHQLINGNRKWDVTMIVERFALTYNKVDLTDPNWATLFNTYYDHISSGDSLNVRFTWDELGFNGLCLVDISPVELLAGQDRRGNFRINLTSIENEDFV